MDRPHAKEGADLGGARTEGSAHERPLADANSQQEGWHKTACVLCSINCGIEVKTEGREIVRVRGDKSHPASQGYTCEKGPARELLPERP